MAGTPGTPAQVLKGASAVKITDFGLSHQLPNGAKFAADMCVGTPFFMAPEVLAAKHFYPASDVYSFGVIMWEIMSGSPVFVRPYVPPPRLFLTHFYVSVTSEFCKSFRTGLRLCPLGRGGIFYHSFPCIVPIPLLLSCSPARLPTVS